MVSASKYLPHETGNHGIKFSYLSKLPRTDLKPRAGCLQTQWNGSSVVVERRQNVLQSGEAVGLTPLLDLVSLCIGKLMILIVPSHGLQNTREPGDEMLGSRERGLTFVPHSGSAFNFRSSASDLAFPRSKALLSWQHLHRKHPLAFTGIQTLFFDEQSKPICALAGQLCLGE